MEKFLKRKSTDELSTASSSRPSGGSSSSTKERKPKLRKYNSSYIAYGFTFVVKNDGVEYPKCVICQEILSNEGMKPSKLQRHLQQKHPTEATKSIDFFKRQESSVASQANTFKQKFTLPDRALKASFLASLHIARGKKPHTIGENFLLPAVRDIVQELFGRDAGNQVDVVPLSNNTVSRRIDDMAEDVTVQLLEQVKNSEYFALQLDESTDVANKAQLLVYIRFISEEKIVEEVLFCKAMTGRTTGKDIFRILDDYMEQNSIDWSRCVGVCTDGAAAMTGKRSGVIAFIKEKAPNVVSTHCMLHREALVAKRIDDELYQVLQVVVKTVNYVKAHPMKDRLFEALCHEMDADFHGLLLHSEVRWLSRGAVLNRVFALRRELAVFLSSHKSDLCIYFEDKSWMLKLAYLSDIFQHLNVLNKSMQGLELCILNVQDKVRAFMQKLSLWEAKCQEGVTEMFPFYHQECMTSSETITAIIVSHLSHLQGYFREYYPELENSHLNWIRNPFAHGVGAHLDMKSQEELIEISNDGGMKIKFSALPLPEFWIYSRTEYHALAEKALKYILPFATTYLCEKGFSTLTILKTKHRARLQVDNDMRLALTDIKPRIDQLCRSHQAHPSH